MLIIKLPKQDYESRELLLACLHDQNKSSFLEGLLLSGQSEQSEKFSKSLDWLEKNLPKKLLLF